ncbi:MAG: NUDIX domain-containing protein [Bacteroidota bacterium]|nr:NUDIX domain-containing protein [Bacteroidota bacterium]
MSQNYKVFINNRLKIIAKDNWGTFLQDYELIEAAGGVVYNQHKKLLMIFRNGKWDLPKGKIEFDEASDKAAIREVIEETGVNDLVIEEKLDETYHTYEVNGKKVIKKTIWYKMFTEFSLSFMPQLKEGITKVVWVDINDIEKKLQNSFTTIATLLKK